MKNCSKHEIRASIMQVLSEILKVEVESEGKREDYPGWDSLKHIDIVFALEDEFSIEFSEQVIEKLNSIDEIVESVFFEKNET